jgi:uncharacterized protein (TIGR02001 family)
MIKSRIVVAAALCAVAGAANAEFTFTPAITTDYDFRGFTQSDSSEEAQVSLDWNLESGLYFGLWGSGVDYGAGNDAVWEADVKMGYLGGDAEESFGYDLGLIGYFYPSSFDSKDVYEIYAGLSKKLGTTLVSGKFYFGPDFDNAFGSKQAYYTELNAAIPLGGFTFGAHLGYSFGQYWIDYPRNAKGMVTHRFDGEHYDYSLGISRSFGHFDLNLKYVNSNDYKSEPTGRSTYIGTVSTTLPWKK